MEYNYILGSFYAGGDFESVGCGGDIRVIVIYETGTPKPSIVDKLAGVKQGSFQTARNTRQIKTILAEEFRVNGEWNTHAVQGRIPAGVDISRALNSKYLDDYVFVPEASPW
ncbi:hypothetical protein C4573_03960 [Candidatus Woesearchaeota archaeon]|nr:MAG: hypothetical protein C4573_03960 [Candidatus Woesearchaeota archaeon]